MYQPPTTKPTQQPTETPAPQPPAGTTLHSAGGPSQATAPTSLDPQKLQRQLGVRQDEANLLMGIAGGLVAALIGAIIWGFISSLTGFQIGWMAIGIGFLVGYAVKIFGKGSEISFGFAGAVLALLGCLAGNVFAMVAMVADHEGLAFFDLFSRLDLSSALALLSEGFGPLDLLFYGVALYFGYKHSFYGLLED